MTEDEVIKLAREIGREMPTDPPGVEFFFYREELLAFVEAIIRHEQQT